jgi:hypothetical protein
LLLGWLSISIKCQSGSALYLKQTLGHVQAVLSGIQQMLSDASHALLLTPSIAALMLVVMTFNIGVILAVCGGFAIGALLFGHAGERSDSGSEVRHVAASSSTTDELEAVFVEGPACCSGGSGCGGGGHSGGQL